MNGERKHAQPVSASREGGSNFPGMPNGKNLLSFGWYWAMATAVMGTWLLAGALPALSFWTPTAKLLLEGLDPRVEYLLGLGFVLSYYVPALLFGRLAADLYARYGDDFWSSFFPSGAGFLTGLAYFFAGTPARSIWGAWLWSIMGGSAGICAGLCAGTIVLRRRQNKRNSPS